MTHKEVVGLLMTPRTEFNIETSEPRTTHRLDCPFNPHIVSVLQLDRNGCWQTFPHANIRLDGLAVILLGLPRGVFRVTVLGINDPKE